MLLLNYIMLNYIILYYISMCPQRASRGEGFAREESRNSRAFLYPRALRPSKIKIRLGSKHRISRFIFCELGVKKPAFIGETYMGSVSKGVFRFRAQNLSNSVFWSENCCSHVIRAQSLREPLRQPLEVPLEVYFLFG